MRHRSETALAWITLAAAILHSALKTYFHIRWGQPLQALIVDYVSVALMLFGSLTSLLTRPWSAAGLLAAGWAYAFGFGWRSLFGRLELLEAGKAAGNGEPTAAIVAILAIVFVVVGAMLARSLALTWRQSRVSGF